MKTTTEYLNENDINWVAVSVVNKKPTYTDTYKNVYVKQLIEDTECLELIEKYVEKKIQEGKADYNMEKACSAQEFMLSNTTLIKKSQQIFILVMNVMNTYSKYFREIFGDNLKHLQMITPQGKIKFEVFNEETQKLEKCKDPSFYCIYLCYKMNISQEDLWLEK